MKKRKSVSLTLGRGEKSRKGGLTAKGRAKYNRLTGSNLKAPVTKKSGLTESEKKRRKSFCDRMEGMKRKMTNIKKKNDPDSRINKALKRWRC
jgi:hypothetical protein